MNNQDTFTKVVSVIGGALALVAITLAGLSYLKGPEPAAGPAAIATPVSQEDVQSRTYQTLVYLTNGGDKQVVASGGELEIQSGGILDVQSGATVGLASLDLNGGTLTWDPTGGTTSVASTDNFITTTIGAGAGKFSVLVGNLVVGNGSPDTSLNGEDAYVEGTIEVDGAANFDGAVDINGNLTSATGAITVADALNVTGNTDLDGTLNVDGAVSSATGAFTVSDSINVSGSVDALADVDVGTFLNLSAQSAISLTEGAIITPTGSYQVLTSAAAVTSSTTTPIETSGIESGDLLVIRNANASDVITIDGTGGTVECKSDIALGASDTVTLIFNGSEWNCLANYDNS